jgi:hypothetical protein
MKVTRSYLRRLISEAIQEEFSQKTKKPKKEGKKIQNRPSVKAPPDKVDDEHEASLSYYDEIGEPGDKAAARHHRRKATKGSKNKNNYRDGNY